MSDFIAGKLGNRGLCVENSEELFETQSFIPNKPMQFSPQAQDVFDCGLELWKYYQSKLNVKVDASFYDIRKYFQDKTNGRMNNSSNDEYYTELIGNLRAKMKLLAKKIEPKVYEYGFLM